MLSGCVRRPSAPSPPPPVPSAQESAPRGVVRVAEGHAARVAAADRFVLEAVLEPDTARVLGEPRVTCNGGQVRIVEASPGERRLTIDYQPGPGSRDLDPNQTV